MHSHPDHWPIHRIPDKTGCFPSGRVRCDGKKSFFSFFTLTPSQIWLKRPVYRGFKGEGRCEGRTFTLTPALTLPSHFRHRKVSCQGFYLQNLTKVPEKYSYLVPTVQHRYTDSIAMPDYQYSYAALLVQGCCTFGARGAALFLALLEAAVFREYMWYVSIAMVYCRYTYAGLLVPDSWTFLVLLF